MKKHVLVTESFLSLHTLRLVIILLTFMPNYLQGQSSGEQGLRPSISDEQTNLIPPSPNAASLGKFVDVPVSLYTGVPSISVPIHTLQVGNLQVPIGLSYHGSGLKVNELAPSVGAGWALSAGGTLSRTVRGIPDNNLYGYFSTRAGEVFGANGDLNEPNPSVIDQILNDIHNQPPSSNDCGYVRDWLGGCIDTEPDMYFISAPGLSHKFMFDRERNYHLLPYDVIEMEHPYEGLSSTWNLPGALNGSSWKVTDKQGTQYFFGGGSTYTEKTISQGSSISPCMSIDDVSSWNLKQMVSASRVDTVYFEYEQEILQYSTNSYTNAIASGNVIGLIPPTISTTSLDVYQNRIKRILSNRGHEIEFIYDTQEREDVIGGYRLKEVVVLYQGIEKKRVQLNHTYYQSLDLNASSKADRTLCLESVVEVDSQGNPLSPYILHYKRYTDGRLALPKRQTNQQDYWGFYEKDPTLGVLERIVYPTGGEARFIFEEHDFSNLNSPAYEEIPFEATYRFDAPEADVNGVKEFAFTVPTRANGDMVTVRINFQSEVSQPAFQSPGHPYYYAQLFQDLGSGQRDYIGSMIEPFGFLNVKSGNYVLRMRMKSYTQGDAVDEIGEGNNTEGFPPSITIGASDFIEVDLEWIGQGSPVLSQKGGGIRIKQVVMEDMLSQTPAMVKYYDYREESTGESSGCLKSKFGHQYQIQASKYLFETTLPTKSLQVSEIVSIDSKVSPVPLGMLQGSAVAYGEVRVLYGQKNASLTLPGSGVNYDPYVDFGNNGLEKHYFTNPGVSLNELNSDYPAVPNAFDEYLYGLPTKTEIFVYAGEDGNGASTFTKVSQEEHFYTNPILKGEVNGIKAAWNELRADNATNLTDAYAFCPMFLHTDPNKKRVTYRIYTQKSEYIQKIRTINTQYDHLANNQAFVSETEFTYHPDNLLPATVTQHLDGNKKIISHTYYPEDFSNLPTTGIYVDNYAAIGDLLNRNQRGVAIAQMVSHVNHQGQEGIVSVQTTAFDHYPIGGTSSTETAILPQKMLMNHESTPSNLSTFQLNAIYELALLEERIEYLAYDEQANPLSLKKTEDTPITYVWGYGGNYPVAKVQGASQLEVEGVGLNQTLLNDPASESALLSELDKLRQQLPEAFVTTYAYDPLRGIKEMVDPNGKKMSYEYDDFGRLKYIQDQDGYIVKTYEYHYASEGTE